jgi:cell division protein FtsZ
MKKEALLAVDDVLVAGIGGAGVKIAGRLHERRPGRFRVVAMDTNERSLAESRIPEKLLMGQNTLRGAGAGGAPEKGRSAASETIEPARALLTGRRLVVCVAGIGGGTGTGAIPVVLRAARELGAVALGLVTLPFSFEGRSRSVIARGALEELRQRTDALVVVPCDRLIKAAGGGTVAESFAGAENALAGTLVGIAGMLGGRTYLGADILRVQQMFRDCDGALTAAFGEAEGRNRAAAAARAAIESPILKSDRVLAGAPAVMVSIVGGNDLQVREADAVMQAVAASVGDGAEISMGITLDDSEGGMSVTILAMEASGQEQAEEAGQPEAVPEPAAKSADKPRSRRGARSRDEKLGYDASARERFKGVDSTVFGGEDLDTPTFIRRGIKIVK